MEQRPVGARLSERHDPVVPGERTVQAIQDVVAAHRRSSSGRRVAPARDSRVALLDIVRGVHDEVHSLTLPLDVPGAAQMRREREAVLTLLDGYLVERLQRQNRPLLVVIGGPSGAGKSTLLNSLVGASISPAGVLRPTTRTPVLLHHPDDAAALSSQHLLPNLRTIADGNGHGPGAADVLDSATPDGTGYVTAYPDLPPTDGLRPDGEILRAVRLVPRTEITQGLAILDSPDLDSWLTSNRELATELLAVADLWLFVTTGTDYADAVPWDLLRAATQRRVTVATVLNRLRPSETGAVRTHFALMLNERGLGTSPVLTIPEVALVDERIPFPFVAALDDWLSRQASVDRLRAGYLGRALRGSLDQIILTLGRLVEAAADQVVADRRLRVDLKATFALAREEITTEALDGRVAAAIADCWVAAGDSAGGGSGGGLFRRLNAALRPTESPYVAIANALRSHLTALIAHHVTTALSRVSDRWRQHPAAASVAVDDVTKLPPRFVAQADSAVADWLEALQQRVPEAAPRAHPGSRWTPVTLALATLAVGVTTDPSAALARQALAEAGAVIPDAVVHEARGALTITLESLVDPEEERLAAILDGAEVSARSSSGLRAAMQALELLKRDLDESGPDAVILAEQPRTGGMRRRARSEPAAVATAPEAVSTEPEAAGSDPG